MIIEVLQILFWLAVILIVYVYFGYPAILWLFSRIKGKITVTLREDYQPTVSLIISAYNEEKVIYKKLENALAIDYPREKLEIIVAANGCTDRTEEIVKTYADSGVILNAIPQPGKTHAQNATVPLAQGEIIVFSDANSIFAPDAISLLVRYFSDNRIGLVQGRTVMDFSRRGLLGKGVSLYVQYEDYLKKLESSLGSCIAGYGGIMAIRKCLYKSLDPNLMEDFSLPLITLDSGYHSLFIYESVMMEKTSRVEADEWRTRSRIVTQDSWGFSIFLRWLMKSKKWFLIFQLVSHKVLRWLILLFLFTMFWTSFVLSGSSFLYSLILWLQVLFYIMALLGWIVHHYGWSVQLLHIPFYFCLVNLAATVGVFKMLMGRRLPTWTKAISTR